jgi:D-cysteine desulfhydrase/L-cysteate sulfo-lyase
LNEDNPAMKLSTHSRIELSQWPTPIERLDRLSALYGGPQIYMKRDDIGSIAMGGNKLRKLEYLMGEARAHGSDVIVTSGALQSNHARLTAAVAAKLGIECHLVLIDEVPGRSDAYHTSANRLLDDLVGAEVRIVPRDADLAGTVQNHAETLRSKGRDPYVVPLGGSNAVGCLGYVECAREIAEQEEALGFEFSHVFVVSGSGGTHAGLLAGMGFSGMRAELVGVTISRPADAQRPILERLLSGLASLTGIDAAEASARIVLDDRMYLPGYGLPNDRSTDAIRDCARSEGVMLDPVYTSKAMAGLRCWIEDGRLTEADRVLFVHTGGAPALFAYREVYG